MTIYELPASRVTQTYFAPCAASGRDVEKLWRKPIEPANWVEDFLQVLPGPGSIGFSKLVSEAEQHICPGCRSTTSEKLAHIMNSEVYDTDYSCSCGLDYTGEDVPWAEDVEPIRADRLKVTEASLADYAYWRARCAPAEAKPIYEEHYLKAVELPDGQRVER